MALGDVNFQTVTIDTNGNLALTGSPTGSGIYAVECFGGVNGDELISISGGSGGAVITLHPGTVGEYFILRDDALTIVLKEHLDFAPQSTMDFITLVDRLGDGTLWLEFDRGRFP